MYNVSEKYLRVVRGSSRTDTIYGTLTFVDGTELELNERNLGQGSVTINKQCISNQELEFGGCMLSELEIKIRSEQSRYAFYGAVIDLVYAVKVDADEWEEVPLGLYTIAEVDTTGVLITAIAYDNLTLLDVPYTYESINGNAYDILNYVSSQTGLELAFEEKDIASFPNHDSISQINADSGCETFRDVVRIVATSMGAIAYADRNGRLQLKLYDREPVTLLTKRHRYSSTVADYLCRYVGLSVTGLKGTYISKAPSTEQGIHMYIEDCAIWDFGTKEELQHRADSLFEYLHTIEYTPCDISMPNDPSYDCGDMIELATDKGNVNSIITSTSWSFRNAMSVVSEGKNSILDGVSTQNEVSNRISRKDLGSAKLLVHNFTNTRALTIGETNVVLGQSTFLTEADTSAIFLLCAQIRVDNVPDTKSDVIIKNKSGVVTPLYDKNGDPLTVQSTDNGKCTATVQYSLNNEPLAYKISEEYENGTHILNLAYVINKLEAQKEYIWKVLLSCENGEILIREGEFSGIIIGQGLVSDEDIWDGNLEFIDEFNLALNSALATNFSSNVDVNVFDPIKNIFGDKFNLTIDAGLNINVNDEPVNVVTQIGDYIKLTTEDGLINITTEDGKTFIRTLGGRGGTNI